MAISNQEAKKLLYNESPVYFRGSKYKKINALIFRKSEYDYAASAELLDMNNDSVIICPLEWIEKSDEEKIMIFRQEEAEVELNKCQEEMTRLLEFVRQNKTEDSQDSLHRLIRKLTSLDRELLKQSRAKNEDEYVRDFSFGGLKDEYGKESIIPQRNEEEIWEN